VIQITEITRRDIFALFRYGIDMDTFFDTERVHYNYYGTLNEIDFLKRIYDFKQLPDFEMCYEDENIWLTQKMMAALYDVWLPTIS